ncbi:MAG: DMT family transporter [Nitrososphaerota archaeon]|jgi:drug/metabolite transporter (DMT)-like permease|nr:DMT family transporter [Nitrososphaerota archaeon]MDG6932946.1 DMT family transporter [Nitrososphaerota archaeon]MDG6935757.1 DMT family transporter [Nitrososphaerota archaeon]MDG6944161.1 DMT family transporter [Nitrososphaerota archaeon]
MKRKTYGYLMLFVALLINSGITIAFKFASNISYIQLLFFISMTGTITSALLMFMEGTQGETKYYFTHPRPFALMAVWAILVYTLLELIFGYTTHYVSASLSAVIYRTYPLMLILMAPFILKERISRWDFVSVVIGFTGLIVVAAAGGGFLISSTAMPFILLLLVGAFFDSLGSAISKRYYYDIYSSVFMYNLLSFAAFFILAYLTGNITFYGMSSNDWIAVLFLGVFQNVLLTYAFVGSFRVTNTTVASNLYLLTPFITIVLSYVLLREEMLVSYFIIAFTVIVGVMVHLKFSRKTTFIIKCGEAEAYDVTPAFVGTRDRKLFESMRGEGRVLGIVVPNGKARYRKREEEMVGRTSMRTVFPEDENPFMVFTLKSEDVALKDDDIEFIADITGFNESKDLLFLMAGNPKRCNGALKIILGNIN